MAEETAATEAPTETQEMLDIGADPAEVDSTLNALMEEHGEPPSEGDADKDVGSPSSRDESGKFKKKDKEETTDEDFESAMAAFQRDGYSKDVIDALAKDEASFTEAGLKRAKAQKETDDKFKEHEQIARELAEVRRVIAKQTEDNGSALPVSATDKPIDDLLKPLISYFGGDNDEDLTKALRQPFESMFKNIRTLEGRLDEAVNVTAREQVAKDFPQITDDTRYVAVKDWMDTLKIKNPNMDRVALMTKAAKIEFGEEIAEGKATKRQRTNRQRDAGSSDTTKGRVSTKDTAETESHEEMADRALDLRMEGKEEEALALEKKIQQIYLD